MEDTWGGSIIRDAGLDDSIDMLECVTATKNTSLHQSSHHCIKVLDKAVRSDLLLISMCIDDQFFVSVDFYLLRVLLMHLNDFLYFIVAAHENT